MIDLFHGSGRIVTVPEFGVGNPRNDYGLGFYCTREKELAKEWACSGIDDGFANQYVLEDEGLSLLRLNEGGYHILNWLAILLENRLFDLANPVAARAKEYILGNYLPDYKKYDVITGYRADDSYFSFAKAFLMNGMTLDQLSRAMRLGRLGEQVVIRSRKAFSRLRFVGVEPVPATIYHLKRVARDQAARDDYRAMLLEEPTGQQVYASTILAEKWKNDDPRLQK